MKIVIRKKGKVHLEDQAQWVAATSSRVLGARVRQTQQILRRHMTENGNLLMTPNIFAYMRQHYGLDKLISYGTEQVPDTTLVVNPEYRRLDGEIRKKAAKLSRLAAQFGGLGLEEDIEPGKVKMHESKKGELQAAVEHLRAELAPLKERLKRVKRHITFGALSESPL
ncbi:MAG: hypothetical protein H7Y05_09600 [Steroidobacteraceae bacterium]|nr:hypothetical protein [Deltaproteobacteria bacterium]